MKRHPKGPEEMSATLYGDVWIKPWRLPDVGMVVASHAHTYDHISYLAHGSVRVWQDGAVVGDFSAPASIRIPARTKHSFETRTPDVLVLCIHNAAHGEAASIHEEHALALED